MKRINIIMFVSLLLMLIYISIAYALENQTVEFKNASGAAWTATGAGEIKQVKPFRNWCSDVHLSGTVTGAAVRIEGNQYGTTYDPTSLYEETCFTAQIAAGICSFCVESQPMNQMRQNVTTITGTSPE